MSSQSISSELLPLANSPATESGELKPLTSLRFFAAVVVIIGHAGNLFGLPAFLWQSTQAVAFFFVLSGFVLTYTYPTLEGVGTLNFYWRRFVRIWPLYVFAVALAFWIDPEADLARPQLRPFQILLNVLMMQVWVIFPAVKGGGGLGGLNLSIHSASWSISTLWMLYLLFPLLIYKFEKSWWWKLPLAFASVATIVLLSKHTALGRFNFEQNSMIRVNNIIYWHFFVRIFEFTLGMCACLWYRKLAARFNPGVASATILELLTIVLIPVFVIGSMFQAKYAADYPEYLGSDWQNWFGMGGVTNFAFAFLLIIFAFGRGLISKLLSTSFFVLLGRISYAIFLIHPIFVHYIRSRKYAFPPLPNWVMIGLMFIIIIYTAHLMWLCIERPMRRFLRGEWDLAKFGGGRPMSPRLAAARVAEVGALAILLVVGIQMAHSRPNIPPPEESRIDLFIPDTRPETRDAKFGDKLVMMGTRMKLVPEGMRLRIAWRSTAHQNLGYTVAIHLIAEPGANPYARYDYAMDEQWIVDNGTEWLDKAVTIPTSKLEGATSVAIGLKGPDGELLKCSPPLAAPTDWDGKRLLIGLK